MVKTKLTTQEFKYLAYNICIKSGNIADNAEEFLLSCCWYAMQYGKFLGVREERKRKRAIKRVNV